MSKKLKFLIGYILWVGVVYLAAAATNATWSLPMWGEFSRGLFGVFGIIFGTFIAGVLSRYITMDR
jgi:hypothetical protein